MEPSVDEECSGFVSTLTGGWELGTIVTATSGAPFTVTVGDGNDPLGTGFNGDFSMDFASLHSRLQPHSRRRELPEYQLLYAADGAYFLIRWRPPPILSVALQIPSPLPRLRRPRALSSVPTCWATLSAINSTGRGLPP